MTEAPNLVALKLARLDVSHRAVMEPTAGFPDLGQQG
jgi:hypothetical protein